LRSGFAQEEMRRSLWKPRYTPVSFSLLLTATAHDGPDGLARVRYLPRVLSQMRSHGVLPREATCNRLLNACVRYGELDTAREVLSLAERAGHTLDPLAIEAYELSVAKLDGDSAGL
jgi:pentatricopeptide repeat protein